MTALQAVLGFAAWTLAMVSIVFLYRSVRLLSGTPINAWPRGSKNPDDAGIATRAADAHANCIENLVVFAAIVLVAQAQGQAELIAPLAGYVLYARIGQSLVHLAGTSPPLVLIRAAFWSAQLILMFWMLWKIFA